MQLQELKLKSTSQQEENDLLKYLVSIQTKLKQTIFNNN
jgi:hypothetical protein